MRQGMLLSILMFFFQAEDGIRDGHVTGVQTCALPISGPLEVAVPADRLRADLSVAIQLHLRGQEVLGTGADGVRRSEERRVGKESGRGWPPNRWEKK